MRGSGFSLSVHPEDANGKKEAHPFTEKSFPAGCYITCKADQPFHIVVGNNSSQHTAFESKTTFSFVVLFFPYSFKLI